MSAEFQLMPGKHFGFCGQASQCQSYLASFYVRRYRLKHPDATIHLRHLDSTHTLPGNERFAQARELLEKEPGATVVTSFVLEPFAKVDAFRHIENLEIVEVSNPRRSLVRLQHGATVWHMKPFDDPTFRYWIPAEQSDVIRPGVDDR